MSGNARGKLKEHFEGVHRNLDWCIHHVAKSATLIQNTLAQMPEFADVHGDPEKEEAFFMTHPMYQAVLALGEGIKQLDDIANDIYGSI